MRTRKSRRDRGDAYGLEIVLMPLCIECMCLMSVQRRTNGVNKVEDNEKSMLLCKVDKNPEFFWGEGVGGRGGG